MRIREMGLRPKVDQPQEDIIIVFSDVSVIFSDISRLCRVVMTSNVKLTIPFLDGPGVILVGNIVQAL
jgi:hypothetical protein